MKHLEILFACLLPTCISLTTVSFPPSISRQPEHEQIFHVSEMQDEEGKPFVLYCEANGNPEPTYRWTKNGQPFDYEAEEGRVRRQPHYGTLYVIKPLDSDEGVYQCFAENIHGVSLSNTVSLRKSELNSFPDEEPKDLYVTEGEPLSLSCNPPYGYPRPTIFWIVQSNTGALHSINSSRITVDPNGNLHFSNTTLSDALDDAHYVCCATSKARDDYKLGNKIMLRVEASGSPGPNIHPPTPQYTSPSNIVVLRGKRLALYCIFGGTPAPTIWWSKKRDSLLPGRVLYDNYGKTLKIRKVDFQDEGTYECTASNGVGTPLSHSMVVTVKAAPYWINAPNNTNGTEDDIVSFECVAGGIPAPTVEWFINGIPLKDVPPNHSRILDESVNVLKINGLKKSDTAVFQCNASNVYGYVFRNFYLNVLGTSTEEKCLPCKGNLGAESIPLHEKFTERTIKCPDCCHECHNETTEVSEKFIHDFKAMLSGDFSDVVVKVKEEEFRLHKVILAARNPYFSSIFKKNMVEKSTGIVKIEDCEPDIFRSFIHFLYTGKVDNLSPENVCDLYETADKYQEDQLKNECLHLLLNTLSVDSFFDYFVLAFRHDEKELYQKAADFFITNRNEIARTLKWQTFLKEFPIQAIELFIKDLEISDN